MQLHRDCVRRGNLCVSRRPLWLTSSQQSQVRWKKNEKSKVDSAQAELNKSELVNHLILWFGVKHKKYIISFSRSN